MKTLLLNESKDVLNVVMNRPDVRNAFSALMVQELTDVFRQAGTRSDLRALCLRGEGKVFCAGADMAYMQEMVNSSFEKNQEDSQVLHGMFEALYQCPLPVVARVQGAAFGGALGLVACSDIVVAEEKTQFCFSEVKLGLAPAVISDFVLRKTSLGFVAPLMLTGRVFSSGEAMAAGLVHHAVAADQLETSVDRVLHHLREAGTEAVRETKKLIQKIPTLTRAQTLVETSKVIAQRRASVEGQEGLKSFLEKRAPRWRPS